MLQVSQKGKRGHGDGADEGGSHLDPDDLMGLTVSQHVSLRVSAPLMDFPTPIAFFVPLPASCLLSPAAVLSLMVTERATHHLCMSSGTKYW